MDKRPDFGQDLEALQENVTIEVGTALKAIRESKNASRPVKTIEVKEPAPSQVASTATSEQAAAASPQPRKRSTGRSNQNAIVERKDAKENITVRIYTDTNELLSEAANWQKVKRQFPATRQDITQEALEDWFRKHGYSLNKPQKITTDSTSE